MKNVLLWTLALGLFILVGVWGNLQTQPGAVVPKKSFLSNSHPTNIGNDLADSLGFNEVLSAALVFKTRSGKRRPFDLGDIRSIRSVHRDFKSFLEKSEEAGLVHGVLKSIVNYDRLGVQGGLGLVPYFKKDMETSDLANLRTYAFANPGLSTRFVSKDFSSVSYLVFVDSVSNDYELAKRFSVDVIQGGHPIGLLQKDLEAEVHDFASIHALSWTVARFWLTRMLYIDNLLLISIGFTLLLIFFWSYTRSLRHTLLLLLGVYGFVLLLVRGSIGFLEATGIFHMQERVFTTLPFALTLVIVVSIASHTWGACLQAVKAGKSPVEGVRKNVGTVLFFAMFVAFVSFALGIVSTDLQVSKEIGILFSLSVLYAWFISMQLVPRLLTTRYFSLDESYLVEKTVLTQALERVSAYASRKSIQTKPITVFGVMFVMIAVSGVCIQQGLFVLGGGAERYLKSTHFEESMEVMNAPGMPGFTSLEFVFTCDPQVHGELSHRNPACITAIQKTAESMSMSSLIRGVEGLPVGEMRYLADSLLHKPYPETDLDVERLFESLESAPDYFDLEPQLLFDNGYRLSFGTIYSDGDILGPLRDQIVETAIKIEGLQADFFGSDATWADVDRAVVKGGIQNVLQDIILLFVLVLLYMKYVVIRRVREKLSPWRVATAVAIPFVFTTTVMVIVMSLFGIPLDTSTASINQMVVAAAADFLFFLLFAYFALVAQDHPEGNIRSIAVAFQESGRAVTADALFNSIAFMPLLLSSFSPIRMLGLLLIIAVVSTWLAAMFLVLPAMKWALK